MLVKKPTTVTVGAAAERLALKHLTKCGLHLVEKNFTARQGEVDLIMMEGDTLVFVEVRYRENSRHGSPEESVNYRKQQKILQAAQIYLQKNNLTERCACRFDVVAIRSLEKKPQINWLKDAFSAF